MKSSRSRSSSFKHIVNFNVLYFSLALGLEYTLSSERRLLFPVSALAMTLELRVRTHSPCSRAVFNGSSTDTSRPHLWHPLTRSIASTVNAARQNGCPKWRLCSRVLWCSRTVSTTMLFHTARQYGCSVHGRLSNYPSRQPVFTGGKKIPVYTCD